MSPDERRPFPARRHGHGDAHEGADASRLLDRIAHLEWCIAEMTSEAPALVSALDETYAHLTPSEARIVGLLLHRAPRVVSRDALLTAACWEKRIDDWPEEKIVDVFISKAKKKLRSAGFPWEITNVHGLGFKVVPRAAMGAMIPAESLPRLEGCERPEVRSEVPEWTRVGTLTEPIRAEAERAFREREGCHR